MTRTRLFLDPLLAAAAALLLTGLVLAVLGHPPVGAMTALLVGAFGDRIAIEATLLRAVPLLLIGLGTAVSFRAGVWNIGGEGQLAVGALLATAVATRALGATPSWVAVPVLLFCGAAAGAGWAWVAAALRNRRGVSEVLSTLMLNFIGIHAIAWAVRGPLQESARTYPQSDSLAEAARLALLPGLGRVHAGLLLALLLAPLAWAFVFRSAAGVRLRAVGSAPAAARFAGVSPELETRRVMWIAGALAGLAGAVEVLGVTGRLFQNLSPGYGFTAIAVALLARLHPLAVVVTATFFAALATGGGAMQRVAGVPSVSVQMIEAFVILISAGFAVSGRR